MNVFVAVDTFGNNEKIEVTKNIEHNPQHVHWLETAMRFCNTFNQTSKLGNRDFSIIGNRMIKSIAHALGSVRYVDSFIALQKKIRLPGSTQSKVRLSQKHLHKV